MPIPDYETLMLPLLKWAGQHPSDELRGTDAVGFLAGLYALTDEEKAELLPSGGTFKFSSRVSWAAPYLKKAHLLDAPRRGLLRITPRGLAVLKQPPTRINGDFLSQWEEFREFQGRKKDKKERMPLPGVATPIESISAQYQQIRESLALEILEKVKGCSPQFFERLVITLLVKMGYGGSLTDAGQAIGKSGDGGIDGVIKEDKLGLDSIYIQAKRWSDRSVGSPEIDQFAGALSKKKASKGIFITTSSFSKEALSSVREYGAKIVLLDGVQVAQYMIDYNVGVAADHVFEIKKIDSDFFEEIA